MRSEDRNPAALLPPSQLSQLPTHIFSFAGNPPFREDSNLSVGLVLKLPTESWTQQESSMHGAKQGGQLSDRSQMQSKVIISPP